MKSHHDRGTRFSYDVEGWIQVKINPQIPESNAHLRTFTVHIENSFHSMESLITESIYNPLINYF